MADTATTRATQAPGGPDSAGLLVLGMHRSGTSVLARILEVCGANVGARVLGGSRGNDAGHWEDAFAVETHDRLLSGLGQRWDDVLPLPRDWQDSTLAGEARHLVRGYVHGDRARHRLWVVKDPRLSLFWDLWSDAAGPRLPVGAVVVARHPVDIARSLAVRDGMAPGHALLLWLKYMERALAVAERVPTVLVSYERLLADWRETLARIATLPGAEPLAQVDDTTGATVDALLQRGAPTDPEAGQRMPAALKAAWEVLEPGIARGAITADAIARFRDSVDAATELAYLVAGESRVLERKLWDRVAAAESAVVDGAAAVRHLPADLEALRQAVEGHRSDLVAAVSGEIRHMQDYAADAIERAATQVAGLQGEASLARDLAPRIDRMADELAARFVALQDQRDELASEAASLRQAANEQRRRQQALEEEAEQLRRAIAERDDRLHVASRDATEAQASVDALQARVDADRRTLAKFEGELQRLRGEAAELASMRASHSWRLTRPLRVLRRLLSGRWSPADSAQLAVRWHRLRGRLPGARRAGEWADYGSLQGSARLAALPDTDAAGDGRLTPPRPGVADIFVWSVIDWHFRFQRPQHLAAALAGRGHRVFYVSNNFVDASAPGFKVEALDRSGRLFQVHLNLAGAPAIYHAMPDAGQEAALRASLSELLAWTRTGRAVSLVQHPYWRALAGAIPNARIVYDCMDHHAGFDDNAPGILAAEEALFGDADLVITTSAWLDEQVAPKAAAATLIRNAADAAFFGTPPTEVYRDARGRQIIGYYGAIAPWFDVGLVRQVAQAYPDALVLLIGSDTIGAAEALADLPNVQMTGELPYADLPRWLHAFDVCLLPFQVLPLTLATNPVKVYEYLAAGKPVVAVDLPEMAQFDGLVAVGDGHESFVAHVGRLLRDPGAAAAVEARKAFACRQSWDHRARELDAALARLPEPRISVVVLAYNNLGFTQACLDSIERHSDYPDLEVIVVDNASTDGSPEFLQAWAAAPSPAGPRRPRIDKPRHDGFAAGNNVGLAAATGKFLVLLNNDTFVTPGWLRTLRAHFRRHPDTGLLGPVTNNIGNEARIEIAYADMDEMVEAAGQYTRRHPGASITLPVAAFFCVMMPRAVYEAVGGLDEAFGVGFFEDDDYCRRVAQAGWTVRCAEDVFVHHHLSASFDALGDQRKRELFERNRSIYEAKWGPWEPHAYRPGR